MSIFFFLVQWGSFKCIHFACITYGIIRLPLCIYFMVRCKLRGFLSTAWEIKAHGFYFNPQVLTHSILTV